MPKKYDYNEQNPFKKFDSSKTFEDRIKDLNDIIQADSKKSNSALKEISNTLKEQKKANESSENRIDKIADITEKNDKLSYLQEQQYDTQILLMKEQNSLLQQILDVFKEDVEYNEKQEDGKGLFSGFGLILIDSQWIEYLYIFICGVCLLNVGVFLILGLECWLDYYLKVFLVYLLQYLKHYFHLKDY